MDRLREAQQKSNPLSQPLLSAKEEEKKARSAKPLTATQQRRTSLTGELQRQMEEFKL